MSFYLNQLCLSSTKKKKKNSVKKIETWENAYYYYKNLRRHRQKNCTGPLSSQNPLDLSGNGSGHKRPMC